MLIFHCICSSFNDVHPLKALLPIEVTEEEIVICVNDEHLVKAESQIEVTKEGIAICVNEWKSLFTKSLSMIYAYKKKKAQLEL